MLYRILLQYPLKKFILNGKISLISLVNADSSYFCRQMVLYREDSLIFANLHKVEASSDNFIVKLDIDRKFTKKYDGQNFEKCWIIAGRRTGGDITLDFEVMIFKIPNFYKMLTYLRYLTIFLFNIDLFGTKI